MFTLHFMLLPTSRVVTQNIYLAIAKSGDFPKWYNHCCQTVWKSSTETFKAAHAVFSVVDWKYSSRVEKKSPDNHPTGQPVIVNSECMNVADPILNGCAILDNRDIVPLSFAPALLSACAPTSGNISTPSQCMLSTFRPLGTGHEYSWVKNSRERQKRDKTVDKS